jgi:probable biosynthetic protein (TIGR04098 family)
VLIEEVELTLSHVDLGCLDEFAAMTLFGNAHCHRITDGTGHSICDITDAAGTTLYPGYYWTHLHVPPHRLLSEHRVWDRIAIGVDVQAFGPMLLSSQYALGRPGEIDGGDSSRWDLAGVPTMHAANAFYLDGDDHRMGTPRVGVIASLRKLAAAPPAMARFRDVRARAHIVPSFVGNVVRDATTPYALSSGRDIRPGRGIMFARFAAIANTALRDVLTRSAAVTMPMPFALAEHLAVLERETFYFDNVRSDRVLAIRVSAHVERCASNYHGSDEALISVGILDAVVEVYDDRNELLVASHAKHLLVVPRAHLGVQAERWVARYAS